MYNSNLSSLVYLVPCGSFYLTRMSCDDHAVQLIKFERAMAAKTKTKHYYSAHNIATGVSFGTYASVHDSNHYNVDRNFPER